MISHDMRGAPLRPLDLCHPLITLLYLLSHYPLSMGTIFLSNYVHVILLRPFTVVGKTDNFSPWRRQCLFLNKGHLVINFAGVLSWLASRILLADCSAVIAPSNFSNLITSSRFSNFFRQNSRKKSNIISLMSQHDRCDIQQRQAYCTWARTGTEIPTSRLTTFWF